MARRGRPKGRRTVVRRNRWIVELVEEFLAFLHDPVIEEPKAFARGRPELYSFLAETEEGKGIDLGQLTGDIIAAGVQSPAQVLRIVRLVHRISGVHPANTAHEAKTTPTARTPRGPTVGMRPKTCDLLLRIVKGSATAEEALRTLHTRSGGMVVKGMEEIEKSGVTMSQATLRKLWGELGLATVDSRKGVKKGNGPADPPAKMPSPKTLETLKRMLSAVQGRNGSDRPLQERTAKLVVLWGKTFRANAEEAGFTFTAQDVQNIRQWTKGVLQPS